MTTLGAARERDPTMKHPQIVVFEGDGLLARHLERKAEQRRWLLRESRQVPACLNLLRAGGPSVLVVKIGRNLIREFTLLNEVHALLPDVPVVLVGDDEDATLQALAHDLGATYVLMPPEPRPHLIELVEHLMAATIARTEPPGVAAAKASTPPLDSETEPESAANA